MLPRRLLRLFGFESRLNRRDRLPRRPAPRLEQLEDRTLLTANLQISLLVPATAAPGQDVTYTISVSNAGSSAASGVTLGDSFPATYQSQTQTGGPTFSLSHSGNSIDDTISSLAAGASATFSVVAQVSSGASDGTVLSDTAGVVAGTGSSTGATVSTTVRDLEVSLAASSTVLAGDALTYTVTVTNAASSALHSVSLTDVLPSAVSYSSQTQTTGPTFSLGHSGNTITDTISSLAAGATATFSVTAQAPSDATGGTNIGDTATVGASSVGSISASASTTVDTSADLQVSLGASSTAVAGDALTYTVTVTNDGPSDAQGVSLSDVLPSAVSYSSQTQTAGPTFSLSHSGNSIDDTISSLAAGATATFSVTALVPSNTTGGSNVADTATAAASGVGSISASTSTTVTTEAVLSVTAVGSTASALVGEDVTYAVTVTNEGPSDAQGVSLSDALPSGLTYQSQAQTGGPTFSLGQSGNTITDTISTLAAGASATFDFVAQVNGDVSNGEVLSNTASATASTGSSGGASVSTTVYTFGSVTLTNPGTQSSTEGATVSLSISATDSGGGTLTYTALGLPDGLQINASTGAVTGTVAAGDAAEGPYTVIVTAGDLAYSAQTAFTWNVSSPVSITNPGTQSSAEGGTASLSISATDSSGGTLAFTASGLPDGLHINTSTGAVTGTVAVGDAAEGPYTVTVTAGDGTYSASVAFSWNVSGPVTMAPVADQSSLEGATISLSLSASDSGGGTLVYTADGLPPGLKINTSTGAVTGTVAAGDADYSQYGVTVTAGDGAYGASQSFTWTVNSPISFVAPADQTNNEGAAVSLTVGASDSSGGTLTYGEVGLPAGLSINESTGVISGTISAGDAAGGPYTVTVFAGDGTYRNNTSFTWNVNGAVSITAPDDQSNNEGDPVSVSISASDSGGGSISYSATGLPNGLSINSGTGVVSGTITAGGSFTPTVTATAADGTAGAGFDWDVSGPITITDPGPQAYNDGDAVSLQVQAADTASGTLAYSASGLPTGLGINSGSGLISGTVGSSVAAGVYTAVLTVSDGTNTDVDKVAWTISAAGQVVVADPGAQTDAEGASVSLSVGASYSGSGTLSYSAVGLPAGLKIDTSTGVISGTVAAGDSAFGPYVVAVTATDGTSTDGQDFTWNVSSPITLTDPGTQTTAEGASVSLSLGGSYSGGGLSYSATGLPGGLKIDASTGVISGTIAVGDASDGPYSVTVQAASGAYAADQTFTWNIGAPVTLTAPADQTNNEGDTVSLSLSATDSGGGTLSYSALGLPAGLKINPSTGIVSGVVAVGDAAGGHYSVTVTAGDGTYSSSQSFTWNVNGPVTITTPADQTNDEGATVSLSLSAADSSGGTLSYAALGLPAGLKINPSTGAITGTISAGDAADGPYEVTIEAADGTYSAETTFNWNVNGPVAVAVPDDQTNNQGDAVSLAVAVSDSAGGALTYSAVGLPNGLSINSGTGVISGTVGDGGSWQPTVTASNGTYGDTEGFNWTVNSFVSISDPGDQFNQIGDAVSLQVPAIDAAAGTLSYSASGLPTGLSINSATGLISGTVGTGASTTTPYSTTVTVGDGTNAAVDVFSWYVSPAGAVVLPNPGAQTDGAGDMVALSVQATDGTGADLYYTASGLPAGLSLNPYTGLVFGTIAASAVSSSPYSVTVTAADAAGNDASQTFNWTVNAAGTVTLANPGDQTNNEGDTASLALSATDSGSGTLAYAAFGLPAGLKINTSTGAITGTVALGDAAGGPYTVTVVANDGTYSASQTFNWNVSSPVTLTPPADQTNNEGDTVSLAIGASDSTSGTLTYSAVGLPAGLKINPSTGAITGTVAVGDAADGPYGVTVVAGDGTYSTSQTFNWNVNSPISFTAPDNQTNNDGDSVSLTISATDSSGGTLTYSAQGLPAGLKIDPSTGVVSGTVALGDSALGSFFPTITAGDGTYSGIASFEWDVNGAIAVTDQGDQANSVGDAVSYQVQATDAGAGTPSYAAVGLPAGLSINTSTGLITGTIGAAAAIGSYVTTVTVSDGTNTASDTFNWTVGAAGVVTLATPANQTNNESDTVSLTLSATDSGGGTLAYFTEGLPPGLKINPSTGVISGTVAVGDAAYSVYTVTVIATDGAHGAEETFTWTVGGPVTLATPTADQTSSEGATVSLSVGASDSSGGTLAYSAVGLPPGLHVNTSTGAITGTVALDAAAAGPYTVVETANDGTYSYSWSFLWNVNGAVTLAGIANQTDDEGDPTLTITATDSVSGAALTFTAEGLPPGLSISGVGASTAEISGDIADGAAAHGPYTVTVTAGDGANSASQIFTWTVDDPVEVVQPADQVFSEGQSVDLQIAASAPSGTLSYSAFDLPLGLSINAATGAITGTIVDGIAAAGNFVSTVVVRDGIFSAFETIDWSVLAPALGLGNAALVGLGTQAAASIARLAATVAPSSPTHDPNNVLTFTTLGGQLAPVTGVRGAFAWFIKWNINPNNPPAKDGGGVIVQHLVVHYAETNGVPPADWNYWEAWPVVLGKAGNIEVQDVTPALKRLQALDPAVLASRFTPEDIKNIKNLKYPYDDDFFIIPQAVGSSGVVTFTAVAYYFPNLSVAKLQSEYGFKLGAVPQSNTYSVQNNAPGELTKIASMFSQNTLAGWTDHVARSIWGWQNDRYQSVPDLLPERYSGHVMDLLPQTPKNDGWKYGHYTEMELLLHALALGLSEYLPGSYGAVLFTPPVPEPSNNTTLLYVGDELAAIAYHGPVQLLNENLNGLVLDPNAGDPEWVQDVVKGYNGFVPLPYRKR